MVRIADKINPVDFYKAVKTDVVLWFRELNAIRVDKQKNKSEQFGIIALSSKLNGELDLYDIDKGRIFSCSLKNGEAEFPVGKYSVYKLTVLLDSSNGDIWELKYRYNYSNGRKVVEINVDSTVTLAFGPPLKVVTMLAKKDSGMVEITGLVIDSLMNRYTIENKNKANNHPTLKVIDSSGAIVYANEFPCGCVGKYSKTVTISLLIGKAFRCEVDFGEMPFIIEKKFPLYRLDESRG